MNSKILGNEKIKVVVFYTILAVILTWPAAWHFFSSVPSIGPDTMQVVGVAGGKANILAEDGIFRGTARLLTETEFNMTTLYAYFFRLFGRIAGYNILFFLSFILSGLGAYLLAYYFTENKPASLAAGIVFAFSPFHMHNSLSTNVGTMHQEWLPFFALYLFKFFDGLRFRHFALAGFFLLLIGFTEHQLLAFTLLFVLIFLVYKIFSQPKIFLRPKLWAYAIVSTIVLIAVFSFMFKSLLAIANSENNFLNPGFKAAVKYSNDSLSVFVPPSFHSLWPDFLSDVRSKFERQPDSTFSVYAGYSVLLLLLAAIVSLLDVGRLKGERRPTSKIIFWAVVAVAFYVFSLGPHLHYKGVLDPPIRLPYYLIHSYLPYYNNIRTVGRFFAWAMLALSVTAAYGIVFLQNILQKKAQNNGKDYGNDEKSGSHTDWELSMRMKVLYSFIGFVIILEFLAVPLKTNTLLHSLFYERLGEDKEQYSILEIPGNTDYDFASRSLVWKSIHKKTTVNGYDFARKNENNYTFQRGTPIIRTLLYDIPGGDDKQNDKDIMKDSYYKVSNEILNYYNIRWIILDHEGLRGDPAKKEADQYYSAKAYLENVVKCASFFEDEYLYACEADRNVAPRHMFIAMDYANKHWVGKDRGKEGIRRWAENGAGVKIVNMAPVPQDGKFNFKVKLYKPLRVKATLNGVQIYDKYITNITDKTYAEVNVKDIKPGENDVIFGVYAADGSEVRSEKKSDVATIYDVEVE